MTEQIISFVFIGIIAVTLFIGIFFVIHHRKDKNIVYSNTIIGGIILIIFFSIYAFLGSGKLPPLQVLGMLVILIAPMNVYPLLSHTIFNDSYFEKTTFVFRKRYFYEDITSCSYREVHSKGGRKPVYTFHMEKGKDIKFGDEVNVDNFIAAVCEKYRELHGGKELPGIETFPRCANFTEIKIAEPDFSLPESTPLRFADLDAKGRIFLETEIGEYKIVYRRIGRTNELAVNGYVYDEYIKLMEFSHELSANVGGHRFTAGFDSKTAQSFMTVDGVTIKRKTRYI